MGVEMDVGMDMGPGPWGIHDLTARHGQHRCFLEKIPHTRSGIMYRSDQSSLTSPSKATMTMQLHVLYIVSGLAVV